tara:strand:+ start:492 stop:929 length:438 start_codon:yes stop_codon:yes gene_type:complete
MNNNISIDKLDRATCANLNIRNQKGWVAVEWMPTKGYSRVVGTARTKQDLIDILEDIRYRWLNPDGFWSYEGGHEDEEADLAMQADAYDICNDSDDDEDAWSHEENLKCIEIAKEESRKMMERDEINDEFKVIFTHGTFKTQVEK